MKRITRPTKVAKNPNHNLFKGPKNKSWMIHYTTMLPNFTNKRVFLNLGTSDLEHAKILRDMMFHDMNIKSADAN
jgi:hypothetical protein